MHDIQATEMLTIITITKDDFDGLRRTVTSTNSLRAEFGVKQLIIDSSSEATSADIKEFLLDAVNTEYRWQEPQGIASAFNLGIDLVATEWTWFLNSGDSFRPEAGSGFLMHLLGNSTADAIIFEIEPMTSRTKYRHPALRSLWPPITGWIPHPATILRAELFKRYGKFSSKYKIAMDGELWLRLFNNDVVADIVSIPLTSYDETGVSSTQLNRVSGEMFEIVTTYKWKLMKTWLASGKQMLLMLRHYYKLKNR